VWYKSAGGIPLIPQRKSKTERASYMKKISAALISVVGATALCAALWAADWPSEGGNPQRDGWSQGEKKLSKETATTGIHLLYTVKFDNKVKGTSDLTSPIILSNLIGWKGFKELLFVGGSSDVVYSIDSDLGKTYFETPLGYKADASQAPSSGILCPGGLTATVAIPGTSAAGRGFAPPGSAAAQRVGRVARTPAPAGRGRGGFGGGPGTLYAVGSDGYLRTLREQDGNADATPPVKFLPANSRATGLNVNGPMIYAATVDECGGNPNSIYAIKTADGTLASFTTGGSGASGAGGTAIGTDGVVYAQIASGHGNVAGAYNDTVLSLKADDLTVQDYFTPPVALPEVPKGVAYPNVTPTVFGYEDKDWIVTGGRDGRIYILDADSLGGADHHTPLYQSDVIVAPDKNFAGNGIWNNFATWLDADGTRWLYASIRGAAAGKFPMSNGPAPAGSIVAFKIEVKDDKPFLTPQWTSRDLVSPAAPVTANGLVFALSTGQPTRLSKENGTPYTVAEWEKMAKPAALYVLDGATGKELFTSGNKAASYSPSGLAVANSRIYFSTHDNTLYAYGIPLEH
jgi:hypothetical protein